MPVNMPGYDMQTKGVIEEQNVWVFYDLPWPFNSSSGLARMALTTKNPFYAEYYKLAVNTQLEFAHLDKEHPFALRSSVPAKINVLQQTGLQR